MDSNTKGSDYSPISILETMSSFSEVESNISLDENKGMLQAAFVTRDF